VAVQAWVFDGGYEASKTVAIAFTDSGVFGNATFTGDYRCDADPGPVPGLIHLSLPLHGAFASPPNFPLGLGASFDPLVPAPLPPPPPDPSQTVTDCVALQNEAALQAHATSLIAQGNALASQVAACLDDVKRLVCDVNAALDQLGAFCLGHPDDCTGPPGGIMCAEGAFENGLDEVVLPPGACAECGQALVGLGDDVAKAPHQLARCSGARNHLQAIRDAAVTASFPGGAISLTRYAILNCAPPAIPIIASVAESAWSQVQAIVGGMPGAAAACGHASLTTSCDLCGPEPREPVTLLPTGAVTVRHTGRALGRIKGALQSTAAHTADPVLAARYAALANRVGSIPDTRVLEVSAPSADPFTQELVALRAAGADDGHQPLAVVLTFVRTRGRAETLNRADRELLEAALELFKSRWRRDARARAATRSRRTPA
jgi:hypothetical protein